MTVSNPSYMQGFPPPRSQTLTFQDGSFYQWPAPKWSFCNIQQLVPTKNVWRGPKAAHKLNYLPIDFDQKTIITKQGLAVPWQEALANTDTDGLAIMHKGNLIYENYRDYLSPHQPHLIMSCAKSMVGVLAEMMITSGELDEQQAVIHYLPELKNTAWHDANVRQVLDMEISMQFDENYLNPASEVWRYLRAGGMLPQTGDWECLTDYLPNIQAQGKHGQAFAYREPNINVASWILRRVSKQHLNLLLSEKIWQHLGVAHDGLYMVDPSGAETTMALTLRCFAQFGEWVRNSGYGHIDPAITTKLFAGGDQHKFALAQLPSMHNWSYKSLWWVRHMDHGNAICARGAHGQLLYIDPTKELVIAWLSSTELSPGYTHDDTRMPMIDSINEACCNI